MHGTGRSPTPCTVRRTCHTVGAALLKTLRQALGVAYTADVEEAWTEVYGVLAGSMKEAASVPA